MSQGMSLTAVILLMLMGFAPAQAQSNRRPQTSDAQLQQQFEEGFLKGCRSGRTEGVTSQNLYCSCLAKRYRSRYSGGELQAMSTLASRLGPDGGNLVSLMMSPDARICIKQS